MVKSSERQLDVLVAGGGLAGLLLAHELRKRGARVAVADDPQSPGAWNAAAGLLNPLRGQRYTLAWRAGEAFTAAREVYGTLNTTGGHPWIVRDIPILRLFASEAEREAGLGRMTMARDAGFPVRELTEIPAGIRPGAHGGLSVSGGAVVWARAVVDALRAPLVAEDAWISKRCVPDELECGEGFVRWKEQDVRARRLVLAGGSDDVGHPFLEHVPLVPVKGESLVIEAPALPAIFALAGEHHLAPRSDGTWTCGGTTSRGVASLSPGGDARDELERFLNRHLECPWKVVGQRTGIRAATRDRLPAVGAVPGREDVFVFNGLGSQGVAYAPWLSRLLAAHLLDGAPLPAEASPGRFARAPKEIRR